MSSTIDAIKILLNRPKDWGTEALAELKAKLLTAPQRFTVDALEKAHKLRYDKALVDIISMVKHASRDREPLLTAEERVGKAFERLTQGQEFTQDQQRWLDRIRQHLPQRFPEPLRHGPRRLPQRRREQHRRIRRVVAEVRPRRPLELGVGGRPVADRGRGVANGDAQVGDRISSDTALRR